MVTSTQTPRQQMVSLPSINTAQEWLQNGMQDLQTTMSSVVPAIHPELTYPLAQGRNLYLPRDVCNIRCMSPQERHNLYAQFWECGHTMLRNSPESPEYSICFELIVEMSDNVSQREKRWHARFYHPQHGTRVESFQRFREIIIQQATPVDLRNTAPPSSETPSTPLQSQKRGTSGIDAEEDARPRKRISREAERQLREDRKSKAGADHERCMAQKDVIDKQYLQGDRSRQATDPYWKKLAAWDDFMAAGNNPQAALGLHKPRRQSKVEEKRPDNSNKRLENDLVTCPEIPSRDLEYYPKKTQNTYMCLHIERSCGGQETCTARTHDCCRNGLSRRELEIAVRRKEERVCAKIEELAFMDHKLDKAHKTWGNWYSKKMRDLDSTLVKAHVPPLDWTHDSRDAQAESTPENLAIAQTAGFPRSQSPSGDSVVFLGTGGPEEREVFHTHNTSPDNDVFNFSLDNAFLPNRDPVLGFPSELFQPDSFNSSGEAFGDWSTMFV